MKSKKPLIAIIPDYEKGSKQGYSVLPYYALRSNYVEALGRLGAGVILLPYDYQMIDDYLQMIDGLLVVGGDFDIDPEKYGENFVNEHTKINKVREEFEYRIVKKALLKGNLPLLGICNGMQLVNVLQNGTLIQHIADEKGFNNHEQRKDANIVSNNQVYHQVKVTKDSKFFNIVKSEYFNTNSTHHQGIKKLGNDLKIAAVTDDNMIEAIEHVNHPFCFGVQWHPEYILDAADDRLFAAFIQACKNYQQNERTK